MEVLRELDIARFLTRGGKVFICPSFHIAFNKEMNDGGTDPDIVALDFSAREIVVVEVTTGSVLTNLLECVRNRQSRWFAPLRRYLKEMETGLDQWPIRFLGFIRETNVERAAKQFVGASDVTFFALEKATFDWAFTESRLAEGLPR